jgi:hypothetical protein
MKYFYETLLISALLNAAIFRTWPEIVILVIVAVLNAVRNHHEVIKKPYRDLGPLEERVDQQKAFLSELSIRLNKLEVNHQDVLKQAEKTKRLILDTDVSLAFSPRATLSKRDQ